MKKPVQNRTWIPMVLIAILLLTSVFIYRHFFETTAFTGKEKSIAVLPFAGEKDNPENDYLNYGMTDEIISQLNKIPDLKVISHPTVSIYKGSKKDIQQIASELKVAAILRGSVEKNGDALKITTRLIDVNSRRTIWSAVYDREMKDIFSIQNELSQIITEHLHAELTDAEKLNIASQPTQNLEAYNQYLKGRYYFSQRNEKSLREGIIYFNRAIQLDSGFARAYSGLSDCYSALSYIGLELPTYAIAKAERAALKAVELNSTLAEPHASLGYINFYFYWDWKSAERELLRAIQINPNYVQAYVSYGYLLNSMERFPEARKALDKAVQLDPLSATINVDMGFYLFYQHQFDQAEKVLQSALAIYPKSLMALAWLGRCYQEQHRYDEAIGVYLKTLDLVKEWSVALAAIGYIYGVTGKKEDAKNILERMKSDSGSRYVTPYGMALVYASIHDMDNAFNCLDLAYKQHSNWLVWLKQDPRWRLIRDDPRYLKLLEKIGLPNYDRVSDKKQ